MQEWFFSENENLDHLDMVGFDDINPCEWMKRFFFLFNTVCVHFGRCSHQASGLMDKQQSTSFKGFQKGAQGKTSLNPSYVLALF